MLRQWRGRTTLLTASSVCLLAAQSYSNYTLTECEQDQSMKNDRKKYSYVIVGYGHAGKAALTTLLQTSSAKSSSILVIDPATKSITDTSFSSPTHVVDMKYNSVTKLNQYDKVLCLDNGEEVQYEQCLLAVGCAPQIIPNKFLDEDLLKDNQKVLDLTNIEDLQYAMDLVGSGGHVTLIGGYAWQNVHHAVQLAAHARSKGFNRSVTVVYPSYGLLASTLPRYISQLLGKKLSSRGIELVPYSQVRYIAASQHHHTSSSPSASQKPMKSPLMVYVAKSYDSLNTSSFPTDCIVFARTPVFKPPVVVAKTGVRQGSAFHGLDRQFQHKRNSHDFIYHSGVELDHIFGGILVNQSLQVGNGLYAAGSCSNVFYHQPSPVSNDDTAVSNAISYRTSMQSDGYSASLGRDAALSMSGDRVVFSNNLPMNIHAENASGVFITTIGNCNSALESHSFWWKNPEEQYFLQTFRNSREENGQSDRAPSSTVSVRGKDGVVKYQNKFKMSQKKSTLSPIGYGITFFTDANVVVGILLSGFPITSTSKDAKQDLERIFQHLLGVKLNQEGPLDASILPPMSSFNNMHDVDQTETPATDETASSTTATYSPLSSRLIRLEELNVTSRSIFSQLLTFVDHHELPQNRTAQTFARHKSSFFTTSSSSASASNELNSSQLEVSRGVYRYALAARASVMEVTDHINKLIIAKQPASIPEGVLNLKSNSGSKSDRLAAAYTSGMVQGGSAYFQAPDSHQEDGLKMFSSLGAKLSSKDFQS